jgi:hypothetical protein
MTEQELRELAASVEEIKKAVRRNNPQLRAMMSARGWMPFAILAGLGMALFCLPAQVLVVAYGRFELIPPVYRTTLWCVLALVLVLSAVWKVVLLAREAAEVEKGAGVGAVLKAFFSGPGFHVGVPYLLAIAVGTVFAVLRGHGWYVVPAIAVPTCFWVNFVAARIDRPIFMAAGWWCLVTGLASLFFMEAAPFIWLFVIFGGLCFVFAGALAVEARRGTAEGR